MDESSISSSVRGTQSSVTTSEAHEQNKEDESLHISEAILLHLMVKHAIPLHTYSKFMKWAQLVNQHLFYLRNYQASVSQ